MASEPIRAAVIGAGPSGLMAAQRLAEAGHPVDLFDAMPSVGRKFLLAGRGGLNLSHTEPLPLFLTRYREAAPWLEPALGAFDLDALKCWAKGLGIDLFEGTSGRMFPTDMKASPLLRRWLQHLVSSGVTVHTRHRWTGWNEAGELCFETPKGPLRRPASPLVLALGGASWPRLGSDGQWQRLLAAAGLDQRPLRPANCGFTRPWSLRFLEQHQGAPVKAVRGWVHDGTSDQSSRAEMVISKTGLEGGLLYALSAPLREMLEHSNEATLHLDLAPDRSLEAVQSAFHRNNPKASWSTRLRRAAGLSPVKIGLLRECCPAFTQEDLPALIKALPVRLSGTQPIERAISSAGGVLWSSLDDQLMSRRHPGVFLAGEMLDWEAPTGGYLLHACLATGHRAGTAAARWRPPAR